MAQGISQAPAVATAIVQSAENGQPVPVPPMMYGRPYGYGYPMYGHHAMLLPIRRDLRLHLLPLSHLRLDEDGLLRRHAASRLGRSQARTLGQALGKRRPTHVRRMAQTRITKKRKKMKVKRNK